MPSHALHSVISQKSSRIADTRDSHARSHFSALFSLSRIASAAPPRLTTAWAGQGGGAGAGRAPAPQARHPPRSMARDPGCGPVGGRPASHSLSRVPGLALAESLAAAKLGLAAARGPSHSLRPEALAAARATRSGPPSPAESLRPAVCSAGPSGFRVHGHCRGPGCCQALKRVWSSGPGRRAVAVPGFTRSGTATRAGRPPGQRLAALTKTRPGAAARDKTRQPALRARLR